MLKLTHAYALTSIGAKMQSDKITICLGLSNIKDRFLDVFYTAYMEHRLYNDTLLSIYDMGDDSLDRDIKSMVSKDILTYTRETSKIYSRTKSFNRAVRQATTDNVFICDVDIALPKSFVAAFTRNVAPGKLWFPITWSQFQSKPIEIGNKEFGWFRHQGFGMMGLTKKDFETVGGYDENIRRWGGEDQKFFYTAKKKHGLKVVRKNSALVHHWHPKDTPWHKQQ